MSFGYGGKANVIDDLTLVIRPGEKIGLVGRSGAGKSTVVNLLLRFYDVERGRILIDGQDIAHATQESLRAQIGMVTQDTSLLHRSVRDNIVYGRPRRHRGRDGRRRGARRGARLHRRRCSDPKGRRALRRARRRARRQALRRPAAAGRDRTRDAEGRADPAARRGDERARLGGRGGDPAEPLPPDGRQDRGGDRASAVDDRGDGPADGARPRARGRGRRPQEPARARRTLRAPVGAPERRLPRRRGGGGGDRSRAAGSEAAIVEEIDREAAARSVEPSRSGHDLPTGSDPVTR